MTTRLNELHAAGFDLSTIDDPAPAHDPPYVHVKCSQCAASVINGVPVHERTCPNENYACSDCDAGRVRRKGSQCQDCFEAEMGTWDEPEPDDDE